MFRAMIDDPYVFGRIAANHALGDLYAMGATPWTALAIATVPYGLPDKTAVTLAHMLSGALDVLNAAGCALVGGHTAEAAELALGFTVNGLIESGEGLRKKNLRAGDKLILTKPLGTGTIFAADMRAKAKGRWVDAAIAAALVTSGAASEILHTHGATACTDVTGFGLARHLAEMLEASGRSAKLEFDRLPVIDGARDTLELRIVSSLQPENETRQDRVRVPAHLNGDPRVRLLFDPQTAGGLLAGVPTAQAGPCLAALHAAGYAAAAVIGEVGDGDAGTIVLK